MLRVAVVAGPGKQTDINLHAVLRCYRIPAIYRQWWSWKNLLNWHSDVIAEAIFTAMSLHGELARVFYLGNLMQDR